MLHQYFNTLNLYSQLQEILLTLKKAWALEHLVRAKHFLSISFALKPIVCPLALSSCHRIKT